MRNVRSDKRWQMEGGTSRAVIPLKPKDGLTRISGTRQQATATCAAFIEESRMKFINANNLHRKSGGMGHPVHPTAACREGLLNPDIPRTGFRFNRGAAAIDGSVYVMLVQGAPHGKREVGLNRAGARLRIQRETSAAANLQ
jgi:hypothetical protein